MAKKEEEKKETKKEEVKKETTTKKEEKKEMKKGEVKKEEPKKETKKKEEPKKEPTISDIPDEDIEKELQARKEKAEAKKKEEEAKRKAEEEEDRKRRYGELPHGACQELQDFWLKGIYGCYDADSDWCKGCETDFPDCFAICKKNTEEMQAQKKETKTKTKRTGERKTSTIGLDPFGQKLTSRAAQFNALLLRPEGATKEELIQIRSDFARRMGVIMFRGSTRGIKILEKEGRYFAIYENAKKEEEEVTTA
jgi:hypothetical protein